MMQTNAAHYRGNDLALVRLWVHECMRIFHDRLIFDEDHEMFLNFLKNGMKEITDYKEEVLLETPLMYTAFVSAAEGHEKSYLPIKSLDHLRGVLEQKLADMQSMKDHIKLIVDQGMPL